MAVIKSRLEVTLELVGKGQYPVISYGSDVSLNAIPTATCSVAVGRRLSDGQPSSANSGIWSIRRYDKVKIWFQGQGEYAGGVDWPQKPELIFEGRVEGMGQRSGNGQQELVIFMRHWLAYLDAASAVSSMMHPGAPLDLIFSAVLATAETTAGGQPNTMGSTAAGAHMVNDWPAVGANFWGNGLKALFWHLASNTSQAVVSESLLRWVPGLVKPGSNPDILDALQRLAGESTIQPDCSTPLPAYAPPLNLRGANALPESAVRAMGNAVGMEMSSSFAQQTLWGKLLSYASQFMFAVVPQISRALVVPFIPSGRQTYCKTLEVNSHEARQLTLQLSRPLRAVAVYNTSGSTTGLSAGSESAVIGGCYAPPVDDPLGLIWIIPPPAWLAGMGFGAWSPAKTTSLRAGKVNSATTPQAIDEEVQDAVPENVVASIEELMNGYAHAVFAVESLRGRVGQVSDKLRFDVAPGSLVRIQSTGDPFLVDSDLVDAIIGCVIGVSIGINAEQSAAGVNFQIEFLRTEKENEDEALTTEKHPLYEDTFVGAPLVDGLQFGECT